MPKRRDLPGPLVAIKEMRGEIGQNLIPMNRADPDTAFSGPEEAEINADKAFLVTSTGTRGAIERNVKEVGGSNKINIQDKLKMKFIKKSKELVDSAGELVLKYKSIQLFCSSLIEVFECKIKADKRSGHWADEEVLFEPQDSSNLKISMWDEEQNILVDLQWKVLSGKYGSVAFAVVSVPPVNGELMIKSQILASSCNMPFKIKNVRAWFHGSSLIRPGWIPENRKLFLAIKSPFKGVHSNGRELWERENLISLLLSRDSFSKFDNGIISVYQISPSIVTFHNNARKVGKTPEVFFVTKSNTGKIKLNDPYRPLFSNYMFMEYLDGVSLEVVLYYLRGKEMFQWLQDKRERWEFWLGAILNLVRVILLSVQSLASTGFFQYMHCDLNFGNIIITRDLEDLSNSENSGRSAKRLLEDKEDHRGNLRILRDLGQGSIRIIDFAFTYVFHHREDEREFAELETFIREKGVHRALGERNFESICKKMIKAAIFNDPNYVSLIVSEVFVGYSVLLNKFLIHREQQGNSGPGVGEDEGREDPSLKWKDSSNPYISFLQKLESGLDFSPEWSQVALDFVENEEPLKRWVSKKGKEKNQKHILSTFNQGVDAYLAVCNKINQATRIANKSGLLKEGKTNSHCLSLEFYIKSYLFLPHGVSKVSSCLFSRTSDNESFQKFIGQKSPYFRFVTFSVSFYMWLKNPEIPNLQVPEFFRVLKDLCHPDVLLGPENNSISHLQNVDYKFERTKSIYSIIYRDQSEFLHSSLSRYNLSVPFSLLLQRTWYRIQDSTEFSNKPLLTSPNLLNTLSEFFKYLQFTFSNSDSPSDFPSDSTLLDLCLASKNHGKEAITKLEGLLGNSNLSHQEFCHLVIKPVESPLF
ncbi:Protein kinase-like domain containing protein [Cryptosporidium felis]|nr:Protein kinase-like domain containing protein [Cryptosporidium felis]